MVQEACRASVVGVVASAFEAETGVQAAMAEAGWAAQVVGWVVEVTLAPHMPPCPGV